MSDVGRMKVDDDHLAKRAVSLCSLTKWSFDDERGAVPADSSNSPPTCRIRVEKAPSRIQRELSLLGITVLWLV
jgi:hypothetical protein